MSDLESMTYQQLFDLAVDIGVLVGDNPTYETLKVRIQQCRLLK